MTQPGPYTPGKTAQAPVYTPEPDGVDYSPHGTEHIETGHVVGVVNDPVRLPWSNGGRPEAFTPEKQQQYLRHIREGVGITNAAYNVDVAPSTVHLFRKKYPEFDEAIKEARRSLIETVESAAFKLVAAGDGPMVRFMLQNLNEEYAPRQQTPAVLQQINATPVEWSLQEARAEVLGMIDELKARRLANAAAVEAESREAVDGG